MSSLEQGDAPATLRTTLVDKITDPNVLNSVYMYKNASRELVSIADMMAAKARGTPMSRNQLFPFKPVGQTAPRKLDRKNWQQPKDATGRMVKELIKQGIEVTDVKARIHLPGFVRMTHDYTIDKADVHLCATNSYRSLVNHMADAAKGVKHDAPQAPSTEPIKLRMNKEEYKELSAKIFPYGYPDLGSIDPRSPLFSQPHNNSNGSADEYSLLVVAYQAATANGDHVEANTIDDAMRTFNKYAQSHFYGSGTPMGQVGRLKRGYDLAKQALEWRNRAGNVVKAALSYTAYARARDNCTPLAAIPDPPPNLAYPAIHLLTDPTYVFTNLEGDRVEHRAYTPNMPSDAGLPWPGNAKKETTVTADIMLAHQMAVDVNKALADSNPSWLRDRWGWVVLNKMKAKAEVYEADEFETKIRNIFVPPNCFSVLPIVLLGVAKNMADSFMTNINTTTLMGFSPAHGGVDQLFNRILEHQRDNKYTLLHYADNLWVYDGETWISIDIRSMEATHPEKFFTFAVRYMLERVYACKFDAREMLVDSGCLDSATANYMYNFYAPNVNRTKGLIREQQVLVRGLPSGAAGTFEYNDAFMAVATNYLRTHEFVPDPRLIIDGRPAPILIKVLNDFGMEAKIVSCVNKPIEEVQANAYRFDHIGAVVPVDLLGFNLACMEIGGQKYSIGVLQQDRIWKAFVFNKAMAKMRGGISESGATNAILRLATITTLYAFGGWAYTELATAMKVVAASYVERLRAYGTEEQTATLMSLANTLADTFREEDSENQWLTAEMAAGILSSIYRTGVPMLWHVVNLMLPHHVILDFEQDLIKDDTALKNLTTLIPGYRIIELAERGAPIPQAILDEARQILSADIKLIDPDLMKPQQVLMKTRKVGPTITEPIKTNKPAIGPAQLPSKPRPKARPWTLANEGKRNEQRLLVKKFIRDFGATETLRLDATGMGPIPDSQLAVSLVARHLRVDKDAIEKDDLKWVNEKRRDGNIVLFRLKRNS